MEFHVIRCITFSVELKLITRSENVHVDADEMCFPALPRICGRVLHWIIQWRELL